MDEPTDCKRFELRGGGGGTRLRVLRGMKCAARGRVLDRPRHVVKDNAKFLFSDLFFAFTAGCPAGPVALWLVMPVRFLGRGGCGGGGGSLRGGIVV